MKATEFESRHNLRMMNWGKREANKLFSSGKPVEYVHKKLLKPNLKAFNEGVLRTNHP